MCSILCLMRSRKRYFSSIPLGTTLFCRFSLLQNPEYDPLLSGRIFEYAAEVGQMSGKNGLREHHFIKILYAAIIFLSQEFNNLMIHYISLHSLHSKHSI